MFVTKNLKFPNDDQAKLVDDEKFPFNVHEVDTPSSGENKGFITIRTSILPESWRKEAAKSGRSSDNNRRKVFENEGYSILRNGREVYYGHILGMRPSLEEKDRFWGCEIDFDPVLDHWFSVKNIKIGARPLKELRDRLQEKLIPVITNNFRIQISKTFDNYKSEKIKQQQGPANSHKEKEEELKEKTKPIKNTLPKKEIIKNIENTATEYFEDSKLQKAFKKELLDENSPFKFIEDYENRADGNFIEIIPNLGKKVVMLNMKHPFWLVVYSKINQIEKIAKESKDQKNKELAIIANELKGNLDNMIYGFVEGYHDLDDLEKEQKINDTIEELIYKWSFHIRKTYKIRVNS